MTYYLIDYENINQEGLNGIEKLNCNDRVYLFFSDNANTLTFQMHKKINECRADFRLEEVKVGKKNALDFQLATYLGYLIALDPNGIYRIVTYDRGFEAVCTYWGEADVKVEIVSDLTGRNMEQEEAILENKIIEAVGDEVTGKKIAKIVKKYKTKQGINNALMRDFPSEGNKVSSSYYQAIKPLLKNKN